MSRAKASYSEVETHRSTRYSRVGLKAYKYPMDVLLDKRDASNISHRTLATQV